MEGTESSLITDYTLKVSDFSYTTFMVWKRRKNEAYGSSSS